ncbi:rRNA pseudouridine synthase [bacterium]|nr:rRNA pseudouridine synthase [bacterium]
MRINKYIALSSDYSRRKADELVISGAVTVNGEIITQLGWEIRKRDVVKINGKIVHPPKEFEYWRFYKPAGYITTKSDEKGRKTIYDILPDEVKHLKAIGRLDKESTGLIILTNDGDLINQLAHPSVKIPKKYRVTTDGDIKVEHLQEFAKGIKIEGKLAWCDSEILEKNKGITTLEITLYQGLNRQIRKMFASFGFKVLSLKRISHATITLTGLKRGDCKVIKPKQIKMLKSYIEKLSK